MKLRRVEDEAAEGEATEFGMKQQCKLCCFMGTASSVGMKKSIGPFMSSRACF